MVRHLYEFTTPPCQPDIMFPAPGVDPLLTLPEGEQVNFDATTVGAIFALSAAQPASAQSPPGELELQQLLQQIGAVDGQTLNPSDQLGPMLDMAELHEAVEDSADAAGIPGPSDSQPWTMDDLANWVNAHPHAAMSLADPSFYFNMGLEVVNAYPHLALNMQPSSLSTDHLDTASVSEGSSMQGSTMDAAAFQMFSYNVQQPQPELAMPIPTAPVAVQVISGSHSSVHSDVSAHTHVSAPTEHSHSDSASASRRYVPPSGAGMPGRRRVAGKFQPRKSDTYDGTA